jgi:thioredoxin 1
MVENFSDADFSDRVEKNPALSLIEFWGEGCAPCRALAPLLEQLAEENKGHLLVGKIKVEDNPKTTTKYGVRGMPTMLFLKNGEIKTMLTGYRNKPEIQKTIDAYK